MPFWQWLELFTLVQSNFRAQAWIWQWLELTLAMIGLFVPRNGWSSANSTTSANISVRSSPRDWLAVPRNWKLPGLLNRPKKLMGKSTCLMGKTSISTGPFSTAMLNYQKLPQNCNLNLKMMLNNEISGYSSFRQSICSLKNGVNSQILLATAAWSFHP